MRATNELTYRMTPKQSIWRAEKVNFINFWSNLNKTFVKQYEEGEEANEILLDIWRIFHIVDNILMASHACNELGFVRVPQIKSEIIWAGDERLNVIRAHFFVSFECSFLIFCPKEREKKLKIFCYFKKMIDVLTLSCFWNFIIIVNAQIEWTGSQHVICV